MITVRDLRMRLDSGGRSVDVLTDITLEVPARQFVAIAGPSGSGKSTLLGLIAGRVPGLTAAAIIALPLLLLAWSEARRRVWLQGHVLSVRVFGTRSVNLREADELDLLVTDVRGSRTVGLFVREVMPALNKA